jgi:hypothetical protein
MARLFLSFPVSMLHFLSYSTGRMKFSFRVLNADGEFEFQFPVLYNL